jgi:pimeloyl-ACP methyl ester carboxylesterase
MFIKKIILKSAITLCLAVVFASCSMQPKLVNGEYQIYKSEEGRIKMMELYAEFLSKWKVPYREIDVDTSYGRTHVIIIGSEKNKKNIIFLTGAGGNSSINHSSVVSAYKDFCIYSIDIIGQPGKSITTKLPKGSKDYADWLEEVFLKLQIEKANVIGSSFGGYISQWFFYYHPERIDKLILVSTSYVKRMPIPIEMIHHGMFSSTEKLLLWANGGNPIKDKEYENLYIKLFTYTNKYCTQYFPYLSLISEEDVKKINKPVLIIMGDNDKFLWNAKEAQKFIKNVNNPFIRFEMIPDEGHFLLNRFDVITKLSNEFLK